MSNKFIKHLDERGIEQKLTVHDMPEENGMAQRLNRTLMEKVRVMIIASQLPQGLWGEALMHAMHLKNRTWTRAIPTGVTLFEMIHDEKLKLKTLPVWGTVIWVHNTSTGKLGMRAKEG
jgi:hypothetical protein